MAKKFSERDHQLEELRIAAHAAKLLPAMIKAALRAEQARDAASAAQYDGTEAALDSALAELFSSIDGLIGSLERAAEPFVKQRVAYTERWSAARWGTRDAALALVGDFKHWHTVADREKRTRGQLPAIEALTAQAQALADATQKVGTAEYLIETEQQIAHGLGEAHVHLFSLTRDDDAIDVATAKSARERLATVRALLGKDA